MALFLVRSNIQMAISPQWVIQSMSCLVLGFSGSADRMVLFPVLSNPRWRPWHGMKEDIDKSRAMSPFAKLCYASNLFAGCAPAWLSCLFLTYWPKCNKAFESGYHCTAVMNAVLFSCSYRNLFKGWLKSMELSETLEKCIAIITYCWMICRTLVSYFRPSVSLLTPIQFAISLSNCGQ